MARKNTIYADILPTMRIFGQFSVYFRTFPVESKQNAVCHSESLFVTCMPNSKCYSAPSAESHTYFDCKNWQFFC